MLDAIIAALAAAFLAAALAACIYTIAATLIVRRDLPRPAPPPGAQPAITVLKPLCGAEPGLHEALASLCTQDYPGAVQILLGVQSEGDSAIAPVRRLIAQWPRCDIELVIAAPGGGSNRKVANLANLAMRARHEVIVAADSDIRVPPQYLTALAASLASPGVGLVTCLYRGVAAAGFWSHLAAMAIDYQFLPSVLVGLRVGRARPCFGSTIALRRETLDRVGGFGAFAEHLADDHAIGAAVRRLGLQVAIAPVVVEHLCSEASLGELLRHELRWARTIRAVDAGGFAGMLLTYPLPLALIGAALGGFGTAAAIIGATALASRAALQVQIDRRLGLTAGRGWLVPLRDLLSFVVYVGSFFIGAVSWRGQRYRVRADGTLVRLEPRVAAKESRS